MLSSPIRQKVYDFRFSVSVVDAFLENYGRVHIFVSKKLHRDPMVMRNLFINAFMYRNARWQVLRETLKRVHNQNLYDQIADLTAEETRKYLTCISSLVEDDLIERDLFEK